MKHIVCIILCLISFQGLFAQYESIKEDVGDNKPKKYENRTLGSEKTGNKKFKFTKRVMQNTITHYNYYFNASNKLQRVIDRARLANKENYLELLPFYDYSLKNTSAQKSDLDSIIYKATAGILLHDLRNNWVDDLYLLIGEAYYFKNDMDSASMTFQFINYNLYPRGKHDEETTVGSSDENSTGLSIANKEKKGFTFVKKPARNDALLWQIKTSINKEEYPEAAGLINTLQNDPNFPPRLRSELEEIDAYWFYQQNMYDSAANHLEKSTYYPQSENKAEKARKEFLIAQLFEISRQTAKAADYYAEAAKHTNDPLMDIYANLNSAKMYKGTGGKDLDNNIAQLLHLAKKGRFVPFKDVIYYSAGELALKKPDTAEAILYYKKSVSYATTNPTVKNRAFLQLADLAYYKKDFKNASAYYDSLELADAAFLTTDVKAITEKRDLLNKIVGKLFIIDREDSLQRIAALAEAPREKFVKALLKRIRKEKGLKEDDGTSTSAFTSSNNNASLDIFGGNAGNGEWYFYNSAARSRGYSDFKSVWGKRDNADNWRRKSAAAAIFNNQPSINGSPDDITDVPNGKVGNANIHTRHIDDNPVNNVIEETTFEGLMSHLPLTPERLMASNKLISAAIFDVANLFLNLEEYGLAAQYYEMSQQRFPDSLYNGQLYLNATYAYRKLNDNSKSAYYKNLLVTKFKDSKYADAVLNNNPSAVHDVAATKRYENIYSLFIEGNFDEAVKEKTSADSIYGKTYWNPQLLYIEAVYYIKQRQDSIAINVLNKIITLYPTSPLKTKASTLISVLNRRSEIENYLTHLNVQRYTDSSVTTDQAIGNNRAVNNNVTNTVTKTVAKPTPPSNKDNASVSNNMVPPGADDVSPSAFNFIAETPQLVVMVLDKVDPVYRSEAKTALDKYNQGRFPAKNITIAKDVLDNEKTLLVFSTFTNADDAMTYMNAIKASASSEISWLPANRYSFIVISQSNLDLLKSNKNLKGYMDVLKAHYPGKF